MQKFIEPASEQLIAWRRDFHHYAEPKWTEFRTTALIAAHLQSLSVPVILGSELTVPGLGFSVPSMEDRRREMERAVRQGADPAIAERTEGLPGAAAVFDTGVPGPVTALRFDIDSLPFSETEDPGHRPNRLGFSSVNPGACHACGHDGHTAIGMGLAVWLAIHCSELCGKIKLIFQPGEEGGGGARGIVKRGHLDDVQYFFSGHVGLTHLDGTPVLSHQLIGGCKDFLDNRRYNIRYRGKAAHPCGDPQNGRNALLAACMAALGIHSIGPHGGGALRVNVGVLNGGLSRNTIADRAYMETETRGENDEVAEYGEMRLLQAARAAAEVYGVDCDIELVGKTTSAQADDAAIDIVMDCAKDIGWFTDLRPIGSVGGTDDASDMMRRVQENGGIGTYIGLGADFTSSFHDPRFDFDEGVLLPALTLFERIIQKLHGRRD